MNVLIIGAGNMGITYGQSFIDANVVSRDHLFFLEKHQGKAPELEAITNNPLHSHPSHFVQRMDLIVLAVKPQDFRVLASALKPFLQPTHLILSIMAGVPIETIQQALGCERVVRAMPNLPAQVGQGMTVFATSEAVDRAQIFQVQNLLNTTGKTLYTPREELLNAATAISGSGPAFVFYYMKAMMETAKQMGFTESESKLLVEQTFRGSVDLLFQHHHSCSEWIRRVSSRGGTTEAAISTFDHIHLDQAIAKGLQAALNRAIELSEPD